MLHDCTEFDDPDHDPLPYHSRARARARAFEPTVVRAVTPGRDDRTPADHKLRAIFLGLVLLAAVVIAAVACWARS
jgi:hypothetical protein